MGLNAQVAVVLEVVALPVFSAMVRDYYLDSNHFIFIWTEVASPDGTYTTGYFGIKYE